MEKVKCEQVAQLTDSGFTEMTGRVYSQQGLSPSIRTFAGGNTEVKIMEEPIIYDDYNGRIKADQSAVGTLTTNCGYNALRHGTKLIEGARVRKLTPKECFRLMGVKDEDYEKIKQSDSSLYHLAGDSIVTTCLMALFAEMVDIKWEEKINYTEWFYGENKNERP